MITLTALLVVMAMIALNALYVAAEFAAVSSRRTRVSEMVREGVSGARALLPILEEPIKLDNYIAACQVGITVSTLVVGAYGQSQLTPVLAPLLSQWGLPTALATTVSVLVILIALTALQMVLGELLPKTVALRYPERLALLTLPPMQVSLFLFRPLIALFNGSAFGILRRVGLEAHSEHGHVHTPTELEVLFTESARGGLIDAGERELLRGVLHLEDRSVREVMVPRVRMVAVNVASAPAAVLRDVTLTPHTRFPVFEETVDRVIGMLHVKDLFHFAHAQPEGDLREIMRPILILPDVLTVQDAWEQLRAQRQHLAVLTDEYGGTSGMLTREDILEEVFGEMQDEFDREEDPIREVGERLIVRGDVAVSTLNERYDLALPDEDAYTISGLVWAELERPPREGDLIELERTELRVDRMHGREVARVSLQRREDRQEPL
ncbi:CBS domain containing-hemolysin-like protein [Deinobacterium chartae]|uniref:CBS domain containing-hemolysin-like protein n=1 Tax=Deinobacterium chartae TaxID=521158 RepID=A0A841I1V8_9DEIO|nr:hemolysin family protein [Deinobacterium chartae]MBB6099046.1 CBS domain containing-hemolysin-like protein [Deinobacterium chartae]